jgi:hypothetical protein
VSSDDPKGSTPPPGGGGVPDLLDEEDHAPGAPRWAAEEPTAMWSDHALRDQGYEDLAEHRKVEPRQETGPATRLDVGGTANSRVELGSELTGGHPALKPRRARKGGVSWAVTIALAVGLSVTVFFLVRFLR